MWWIFRDFDLEEYEQNIDVKKDSILTVTKELFNDIDHEEIRKGNIFKQFVIYSIFIVSILFLLPLLYYTIRYKIWNFERKYPEKLV